MLFSILKGGPKSGNWGHRGRLGQHGGSSSGGGVGALGLSPQASREDRVIASSELKKVRSSVKEDIKRVAEKFGYPDDLMSYEDKGYKFTVDGDNYIAAADYNPFTGKIRFFEGSVTDSKLAESIVSHEVTHAKFNKFEEEASRQHAEITQRLQEESKRGIPYRDSFMRPDGAFREPKDVVRYKLSDMRDNLTSNWVTSLSDSDGVSNYSRSYWKQYYSSHKTKDLLLAVNETLAEISAKKVKDKNYLPPALWEDIHNEVMSL